MRTAPAPRSAAAAAAAPQGPKRVAFCAAAARHLWFGSDGPVGREPFAALWREHVGSEASPDDRADGVRRSERGMRWRRMYDTPVAVVHGQWFFAHERLEQIEHRLDELGWPASA